MTYEICKCESLQIHILKTKNWKVLCGYNGPMFISNTKSFISTQSHEPFGGYFATL